jgi:hypothetical protein
MGTLSLLARRCEPFYAPERVFALTRQGSRSVERPARRRQQRRIDFDTYLAGCKTVLILRPVKRGNFAYSYFSR